MPDQKEATQVGGSSATSRRPSTTLGVVATVGKSRHASLVVPKDFVNEAVWDRVLRIVLGGIMIYLGWFVLADTLWGAALKIFALIPIVTGIIGWDPFYTLLGLSTKTTHRNRTPFSG